MLNSQEERELGGGASAQSTRKKGKKTCFNLSQQGNEHAESKLRQSQISDNQQ